MHASPGARRPVVNGASSEAGQSLAEFAIIIVVLVLIILGIIDFSRAVYARNVVASAAREGARYAITNPSDTAGIERAAKALAVGLDERELHVTVTRPDEERVQVEVSYTFRPASSLIGGYLDGGSGSGIVLRGRSLMRIER